jgi:ligand-binding sensor domain-containing protein
MKGFILFFILILIGCSAEKTQKSSVSFSISTKNFAITGTQNTSSSDAMMLVLINKTTNKQQTLRLSERNVNINLEYGVWEIVALDWREFYSVLYCGRVTKNFNQESDGVILELSQDACNSSFFSSNEYRNDEGLNYLTLINCNSASNVSSNIFEYCESTDRGGAESYQIHFIENDYSTFSEIQAIDLDSISKISSACVEGEPFPGVLTYLLTQIPFGSPEFKLPLSIESFESQDCTGGSSEVYFPAGLGAAPRSGTVKIFTDEYSNFLYVPFQGTFLWGSLDFGNVLPSSSGVETFVFTNSTNSSLSNINISTSAPFSIKSKTCQGSLPKNSSCMIEVEFLPSATGDFFSDLNISYFSGNLSTSKSYELMGYSSFSTAPLAVDANTTLTEDTSAIIQLNYIDAENDLATSCEIESALNALILQGCYCSNGACFVDVIPEKNSTTNGVINFRVTAGGQESSNPGQVFFNVTSVDDSLVAQNMTRKLTPVSNTSIILDYVAPDGIVATSCAHVNTFNLSVVTACSCNGGGQCSITVQPNAGILGISSFSYKVTNASGDSNIAYVFLHAEFPNQFISLPQNHPLFNSIASNRVNNFFIDSAAKMYASTDYGLSISSNSGTSWTTKTTSNGLAHNQINDTYAVGIDIFVATENGLSVSDNNGETFETMTTTEGLPSNQIKKIYKDLAGKFYFATPNGLAKSSDFVATFSNFLPGVDVNDIKVYVADPGNPGDDLVYVATNNGLIKSIDSLQNYATLLPGKVITSAKLNSTGLLIVGTASDGVYISSNNGSTFTQKTTVNGLRSNVINSVIVSSANNIYVSTSAGVDISTDDGATFVSTNLPDAENLFYYETASSLWASTDNGVIFSADEGVNVLSHVSASNISNSSIFDITKGPSNTLYLATNNGVALSINDGASFTHVSTPFAIRSVFAMADNSTYLLTDDGLKIFNSNNTYDPLTISDPVDDMEFDYSSGTMYVAGENGLYISADKGTSFVVQGTTSGLESEVIHRVSLDNSGNIYLATANGISISVDGGETFTTSLNSSALPVSFNDIAVSPNGVHIFAASDHGLYVSHDSGISFNLKTTAHGLADNEVLNLAIDEQGVLYAGTSEGLSVSTTNGYSFTNYSTVNGISSNEIHRIFVDDRGIIYLGTDHGLSVSYSNIFLGLMSSNLLATFVDFGVPSGTTYLTYEIKNLGNTPTTNLSYNNLTGAGQLTTNSVSTLLGPPCAVALGPTQQCSVLIHWVYNNAAPGVQDGNLNLSADGLSFDFYLTGFQLPPN